MPDQSTFYDLVAAEWRNRGVPLMHPASETEVERVFADLGCLLSADVKSLYAVVGGFVDNGWDEYWSLWPLDLIRKENRHQKRPFVMFADYLISSHLYCFHYENPEISSIYISHDGSTLEPAPVAANLAEFLEKLLCNPNEVEAWKFK